jgi:hypothetical protein
MWMTLMMTQMMWNWSTTQIKTSMPQIQMISAMQSNLLAKYAHEENS